MKRTWVQRNGKLIEVFRDNSGSASVSPSIRADVEPFKSPIDGTIINTRAQLLAHNQRHGVTNDLDSLRECTKRHLENQQTAGTTDRDRRERVAQLVDAYDRAAASGFHRHVRYENDKLQ